MDVVHRNYTGLALVGKSLKGGPITPTMINLTGTAKTIFDEVMDEIDEEINQAFEGIFSEDVLRTLVTGIQDAVKEDVTRTISENYSDGMKAVHKLILGEKTSRVVTKMAKEKLSELSSDIIKRSFDVVDELRNEIIGEVFEETES